MPWTAISYLKLFILRAYVTCSFPVKLFESVRNCIQSKELKLPKVCLKPTGIYSLTCKKPGGTQFRDGTVAH